jgi:hypothetical protein
MGRIVNDQIQGTAMINLGLITVMTFPQLLAARRRYGPAAHLTLLLLSLVSVAAFFVFVPLQSAMGSEQTPAPNLNYLGFAAIGLAGLVPLFWALEQMFPTYNFVVATLLAQALGLLFTAALVLLSSSALPSLLEGAALALVLALYGAGLHVVHYGKLK